MRRELFELHDREWATPEQARTALHAWVVEYNTERPHRSCGGRVPAERFTARAKPVRAADVEPVQGESRLAAEVSATLPGGVSRWG